MGWMADLRLWQRDGPGRATSGSWRIAQERMPWDGAWWRALLNAVPLILAQAVSWAVGGARRNTLSQGVIAHETDAA